MGRITIKDVFKQVKADLIGKDSYRGVTLTYSWLANQFGHISLGFIFSSVAYFLYQKTNDVEQAGIKAASTIAIIWICFEVYNFLGPLLLKKKTNSKLLFVSGPKYQFQPAWANIAFDTFTDMCFFALGSFLCAFILVYFNLGNTKIIIYILLILLLILQYPIHYWFITKMYEQAAQFPFQYRLSQFDLPISDEAKQSILYWLADNHKAKHLLIFGGVNCGKTSLSVGVANEKAIKHQSVTYTTATKLISMFFTPPQPDQENAYPWNWQNSSYLVVDDINPGDPVKEVIITAEYFLQLMDTYSSENEPNRAIFRNTSVIWVLGSDDSERNLQDDWKSMLHKIGVAKDHICSVEL
ncbi:MAG: ATP-binding protein [Bacteroidota bacterium]